MDIFIAYPTLMMGVFFLLLILYSIRILREYERGVIFLLGRFWKVKGPGLIIVIPFIQKIVRVDLPSTICLARACTISAEFRNRWKLVSTTIDAVSSVPSAFIARIAESGSATPSSSASAVPERRKPASISQVANRHPCW